MSDLYERREERRAELAASFADGDGLDAIGQVYEYGGDEADEPEYEYEPEQEWADDDTETEWQQPAEVPQVESADDQIAQFEQHLSQLERDTGIPVPHAARRDIVLTSIEQGGLSHDRTEALFYRHAQRALESREDAATAAEQDMADRRRSKDPIVRRNARREAIVRAMERGQ